MFHRPKSEAQPSHSTQNEQVEAVQENNPVASAQQKNVSMQKDMETQNNVHTNAQTNTMNEKENTKMSSQTTSDQQASSEASARPAAPAGTGPFQRQGQSVPAGRYSAAGNSSSYSAPTSYASPSSSSDSDRKLTLGPGITMSGEIEACDHLIVEGTVEAALKGAKILEIAETGVYFGTVEIEDATIAGRFEGDLTVHGRLTIRSGGSITGSISYGELAVEAGATLDGSITPLVRKDASSAKKQPKKSATVQASAPANELPLSDTAAA